MTKFNKEPGRWEREAGEASLRKSHLCSSCGRTRGWGLERAVLGECWGSRKNGCAKALWHSSESGLRNWGRQAWLQGREQSEERWER